MGAQPTTPSAAHAGPQAASSLPGDERPLPPFHRRQGAEPAYPESSRRDRRGQTPALCLPNPMALSGTGQQALACLPFTHHSHTSSAPRGGGSQHSPRPCYHGASSPASHKPRTDLRSFRHLTVAPTLHTHTRFFYSRKCVRTLQTCGGNVWDQFLCVVQT